MSLIKIIKDGRELVLYPGTKIKFILKSPLFLYGPAPASRTLQFRVPAEPNDLLLGFTRLPDNRSKVWSIEGFQIFLGGNYWKSAKLVVTKIKQTEYDVQLLLDKGYIAENAQKSIREFDYKYLNCNHRIFANNCERTEFIVDPIAGDPLAVNFAFTFTFNVLLETYTYVITFDTVIDIVNSSDPLLSYLDRIINTINADYETHQHYAYRISNSLFIAFTGGYSSLINTLVISGTGSTTDITFSVLDYRFNGTYPPNELLSDIIDEVITTPLDYEYVFYPVKNPNYFGNNNDKTDLDLLVSTSEINYANAYFPVNYNPLSGTANGYEGPFSPFMYLHVVLNYIHKYLGFKVDDQFFDDELKTLNLVNLIDITDRLKKTSSVVLTTARSFKVNDALPDMTLSKFYESIGNSFCTIFDYNTSNNTIRILPRKTILQFTEDADWTNIVSVYFEGDSKKTNINLAYEFDSEDNAPSELLKEPILLNRKDDVTNGTDLLLLTNADNQSLDYRLVYIDNKFYLVTKIPSSSDDWKVQSEDLFPLKGINKDVEQIDIITACTPLFSGIEFIGTTSSSGYTWFALLLPYISQVGKSRIAGSLYGESGLKILFYRGLRNVFVSNNVEEGTPNIIDINPSGGSETYPLGTYNNYNLDGTVIGEYSLKWDGDYGLKAKWWQPWVDYLLNLERYEWDVVMGLSEIQNLDLLKPKRVKNQLYFIDEIEVDIGDVIETARVITYKK